MATKASALCIAYLVLFAHLAVPLRAAALHDDEAAHQHGRGARGAVAGADDLRSVEVGASGSHFNRALMRRGGRGAAFGAAEGLTVEVGAGGSLSEELGKVDATVDLELLIAQHAESAAERHSAELWAELSAKYPSQFHGCHHDTGGMMPCPEGQVCHYTEQHKALGDGMGVTSEKRGDIVRLLLEQSSAAGSALPHVTMYLTNGATASAKHAPSMLAQVPGAFLKNSDKEVLLKMLFVQSADVTETCPSSNQLVETQGDFSVSYTVGDGNNSMTVQEKDAKGDMLGITMKLESQEPSKSSKKFQVPAALQIQTVSQAEMLQVLTTRTLPASIAPAPTPGVDVSLAEEHRLDRALTTKDTGACVGMLVGGFAAAGAAIAACMFTLIGCVIVTPVMLFVAQVLISNGLPNCS